MPLEKVGRRAGPWRWDGRLGGRSVTQALLAARPTLSAAHHLELLDFKSSQQVACEQMVQEALAMSFHASLRFIASLASS